MFGQTFQILILEMGKIALSGIYRFLPETLRHPLLRSCLTTTLNRTSWFCHMACHRPEVLPPRQCSRISLTSASSLVRLVLPARPHQPSSLGPARRIKASNVLVTHLTIPDASW